MCGIAGSWVRNGTETHGQRLQAGLETIRHRGPDDSGQFAWASESTDARVDLGMVRLAILDLSPLGHQPMTLPGGRFTMVFNGEITNYVEIREELEALGETFVSQGDTEVLLKAWARWGTQALDRLEGMYAFAILDTKDRTLTLVRDPFGVKPLFIAHNKERVVFNSELRGLLATTQEQPRLDWQAASDYLQWGVYDQAERTFIDGVTQLAPGHFLVINIDSGACSAPTRYWHPSVARSFHGTYQDAVETVRGLFIESVRHNLRSDVPLGIALSGGIDSSAIAGAARFLEPDLPISTFSYIAPGFVESEHEWISTVAQSLGVVSHTTASTAEDLENDIDDLILTQGEPFGSTSIYAQYRVFKLAREHGMVVTLDGQGGDEVFAGYHGYPAQRMRSLLETGRWLGAARFARAWGSWPGRDTRSMLIEAAGQFVPRRLRGRVLPLSTSPLINYDALRERGVDVKFPPVQGTSQWGRRVPAHLRVAQTRVGLPGLLRHGDLDSMRFSVESRVPFLDRALVEYVLSLPEEWLIGPDGTTKRILRDSMRGLVPAEVIDRRDKVGFSTPQSDWLNRLASEPVDPEHPIGFLLDGREPTVAGGFTEAELQGGRDAYWRLINLRRWVALMGVDAR